MTRNRRSAEGRRRAGGNGDQSSRDSRQYQSGFAPRGLAGPVARRSRSSGTAHRSVSARWLPRRASAPRSSRPARRTAPCGRAPTRPGGPLRMAPFTLPPTTCASSSPAHRCATLGCATGVCVSFSPHTNRRMLLLLYGVDNAPGPRVAPMIRRSTSALQVGHARWHRGALPRWMLDTTALRTDAHARAHSTLGWDRNTESRSCSWRSLSARSSERLPEIARSTSEEVDGHRDRGRADGST